MKKSSLILLLFLIVPIFVLAQTIVEPKTKTATTFAIIIDSESYQKTKQAVEAYRDIVESDNLGTYIIYDDWKSPQAIRDLLEKLHNDKQHPLEGAVFIGEIPVPMLRDAQHLTSAFKMDQRRDWKLSSVPSDRYYDDFGLKFDFLSQDTIKTDYFYYSLRADSRQFVAPDIYSGRIKPLAKGKEDKFTQIENYLLKVVKERTENAGNVVNYLTMARGHGYNSESLVSWSGEQLALREQFPDVFKAGGLARFMDFGSKHPVKPYYLNEIQRDELDVMLFHHHGSHYYQFLNGYRYVSDPQNSIENVKRYLRGKVQSAVERGATREEAMKQYMDYLDVPRSWVEETFDSQKIEEDSLFNLSLDISVPDLLSLTPNARFVMLDACYNGSFYRDEYVAGAYIFNNGKTIVTQGNTVNVIQDKWPDEFLGLLAGGIRVGQWNRQIQYLETHIIGDPTFRFANNTLDFDINKALTNHDTDSKYWLKLTAHDSPDVQALAYNMLYKNDYEGLSDKLRNRYFESPYGVVRMEALKLLSKIDDKNFIEVLNASVDDSYELVRRFGVEWICKNSADELIPAFVRSLILDNSSSRVNFKQTHFVKLLDLDKVQAEIARQLEEGTFYDTSVAETFSKDLERYKESAVRDMNTIMDKESENKYKLQEIRLFRNHPNVAAIDNLLEFAADKERTTELRVAALETLGWYTYSYKRGDVVNGLQNIIANDKDEAIINEATKSINRLLKP